MNDIEEWHKLRKEFNLVRKDRKSLERLIINFCKAFLVDHKGRPLRLRPIQIQIVVECLTNRYLMLLSPRGSGKSKALSVAVTIWAYFYRSGEKIIIVAPQMKQCKIIFNDVITNITTSPILSKTKMIKTLRTENEPILVVDGGSSVIPYPAETKREGQSIRGVHATFCVVDESPSIPDNLFDANIEPIVLANRAPFINIGTPKTRDNHTYKYLNDDNYDHFKRMTFTYVDAMDKGDAYETPWSEEDIEIKKNTWGVDSVKFRTEYLCEFIEETGQLFSANDFHFYNLDAFYRDPKMLKGETFLTVDLARTRNSVIIALWEAITVKDKDVLVLRDIKEIIPSKKKGGLDPDKVKAAIVEYGIFFRVSAMVIDATGDGNTMYNNVKKEYRERQISVRVLPFVFTINKAEHYAKYQQHVRMGSILLPRPSSLKKAHERAKMDKCMQQHFELSFSFAKDLRHLLVKNEKHRHDDFPDCMSMSYLLMGKVKHVTTVLSTEQKVNFLPDQKRGQLPLRGRFDSDFDKEKYGGDLLG